MDETDIEISQMLLVNSRTPYRVLAGRLKLSVNAVHKRIQAMIDAGIVRGFIARPNLFIAGALNVYIFGFARAEPLRELPSKLSENDSVYWVAQAGSGYIYVGAYVRGLSELSTVSDFIRKTTDMYNPTVGIIDFGVNIEYPPRDILDTLDWQIISAFSKDSRKPIADVAQELSISVKTIRRHLNTMTKNNFIELSIDWYPDASDDIISVFHTKLSMEAKVNSVELHKKYGPHLIYNLGFSNLPDEHILVIWTRTMKELKELKEKIENDPNFRSATMNILYTGDIFPTWMETLPSKMCLIENPDK